MSIYPFESPTISINEEQARVDLDFTPIKEEIEYPSWLDYSVMK